MTIDCYLSEHCGSYHELRENLNLALVELGRTADIRFHTVTYEEAVAQGIKGSPFLRVDGRDLLTDGSPGIL